MARTIATTTHVDRDAMLDFARPRHHMVLVTSRSDGRPQVSPVTGGVDGDCEVLDLPDSALPLVDYFRSISGEHPGWDEYRQAMRDQGKSLLRITPTRWGPVATGGFPARLAD